VPKIDEMKKQIKAAERKTGGFSFYQTLHKGKIVDGDALSTTEKPAAQFLIKDKANIQPLADDPDKLPVETLTMYKRKGRTQVVEFNALDTTVRISRKAIKKLQQSAKIYLNENTFAKIEYKKAIGKVGQRTAEKAANGMHLQNLATSVCHAQQIHLLVTSEIINSQAITCTLPKAEADLSHKLPLTLLSSPALNFEYGHAKGLSKEQSSILIENMYHNLFSAAVSEGCQVITMPAAGLGVFGGNPETYFTALAKVAQEYPGLLIAYHPGHPKHNPTFTEAVTTCSTNNIMQLSKDVVFVADNLRKQGVKVALHNPSDSDVMFGVYDVGEYWQYGKGDRYVGEEHIGSMSTAPLNSFGLNPAAYNTVISRPLGTKLEAQSIQSATLFGSTSAPGQPTTEAETASSSTPGATV
jgi:hypothetical protein